MRDSKGYYQSPLYNDSLAHIEVGFRSFALSGIKFSLQFFAVFLVCLAYKFVYSFIEGLFKLKTEVFKFLITNTFISKPFAEERCFSAISKGFP